MSNAASQQKTIAVALTLLRFSDLVCLNIVNNRMTLGRWVKTGNFPAPIRLGANTVAWRAEDIQGWLEERTSRRGAK